MNIGDILGRPQLTGDIGLEFEIEGNNLPNRGWKGWGITRDGSLKSGLEAYEYVVSSPIKREDLRTTLTAFNKKFEKSEVIDSIYAGVHTHVNVLDLTPKQLITYICAILIVEDALVEYCGTTRIGNHFCLRTSDAKGLINYIRDVIVNDDLFKCDNDNIRYASFNLKSVIKYGSLEFRTLNSTIDIERVMIWCNTLLNIKGWSLQFSSPIDLVEQASKVGPLNFSRNMVREYAPYFYFTAPSAKEGLEKAEDIAYCKNWDMVNLNLFKSRRGAF